MSMFGGVDLLGAENGGGIVDSVAFVLHLTEKDEGKRGQTKEDLFVEVRDVAEDESIEQTRRARRLRRGQTLVRVCHRRVHHRDREETRRGALVVGGIETHRAKKLDSRVGHRLVDLNQFDPIGRRGRRVIGAMEVVGSEEDEGEKDLVEVSLAEQLFEVMFEKEVKEIPGELLHRAFRRSEETFGEQIQPVESQLVQLPVEHRVRR